MAAINPTNLIGVITAAVNGAVGKDITSLQGFARSQVDGLAKQAQLIAGALAAGHLTDAQRDFFLGDLKRTAQDFVKVLAGLTALEVEKAWNAAVNALWSAIGQAAGVALPKPF